MSLPHSNAALQIPVSFAVILTFHGHQSTGRGLGPSAPQNQQEIRLPHSPFPAHTRARARAQTHTPTHTHTHTHVSANVTIQITGKSHKFLVFK